MLPQVEETETGVLITIPTSSGRVLFHAEEIENPKAHTLEANVTVWQESPGISPEPLTARLNVLSLSQREVFRRQMDDAFGKATWTTILNRTCQILKRVWNEKDWTVDLATVEADTKTPYRLYPWVLDGLPSILFGPGGVGKTYLVLKLARQVIDAGGIVLMVDYENTERQTKARLVKLGGWEGLVYWPGGGRPLAESIPALQRTCQQCAVSLLVVDSAALACGGDPKDEQVALRYFNGLSQLGLASITIAHMTKDEKDDKHPYGSIFWFNSARLIWNVKGSDEDENPRHLGLFCRKSNEDVRHKPFGMRMDFGEDTVTVEREELVSELTQHVSLRVRIRKLLSRGKMTRAELAEELDANDEAVRKTLSRMDDARSEGRSPHSHWYLHGDAE